MDDTTRKPLLVGVDDSDCAREALRFAARLARDLALPLEVVTAWSMLTVPTPARDDPGVVPPLAAWQERADELLARLVSEVLGDDAGLELRLTAVHGRPVTVLLEAAQGASHLVVGSRGRGGFAGLLLGSTSEQLVRHAPCPVTVVRSA